MYSRSKKWLPNLNYSTVYFLFFCLHCTWFCIAPVSVFTQITMLPDWLFSLFISVSVSRKYFYFKQTSLIGVYLTLDRAVVECLRACVNPNPCRKYVDLAKMKRLACCSIMFRPQLIIISSSLNINLMLCSWKRMRSLSSTANFEWNSQTSDRGESLKVTCQLSLLSISRRTTGGALNGFFRIVLVKRPPCFELEWASDHLVYGSIIASQWSMGRELIQAVRLSDSQTSRNPESTSVFVNRYRERPQSKSEVAIRVRRGQMLVCQMVKEERSLLSICILL